MRNVGLDEAQFGIEVETQVEAQDCQEKYQ